MGPLLFFLFLLFMVLLVEPAVELLTDGPFPHPDLWVLSLLPPPLPRPSPPGWTSSSSLWLLKSPTSRPFF